MTDQPRLVLTLSCPDVAGLVAAVSTFLFQAGAFVVESADYGDPDTGLFFMRTVFRGDAHGIKIEVMRESFASLGRRFNMTWTLEEADRPVGDDDFRRLRGQRRSFVTEDLSDEKIMAIAGSRMDPRHAHLDALLSPA